MGTDLSIVRYSKKYEKQVIDLVGGILCELDVVPQSELPLDDEDLYHITDVYKGRGGFWVAVTSHDEVVGTVGIKEMDQTKAKLKRMFVSPNYRGTGISQKLLDTAILFAKGAGYLTLQLNTHLNMKRAHRFYEKNGFKKTDTGSCDPVCSYHYVREL
ncbi:MAG: GNAT family N-acetyltransferase [Microgenomates group bacterium]